MSAFAQVKEHPLFVIAGAAVAAGAVVFGVTTYFCEQISAKQLLEREAKWQKEKDDLQVRASSIERRLGQDQFLDIGKLTRTYAPEQIDVRIKGMDNYREHGFWAVTDTEKWEKKSLSEGEHVRQVTGIRLQEIYDSTTVSKLAEVKGPRWFGKKGIRYRYREKEGPHLEEFPFIMVQKFDRNDNLNYIRILNSAITRQSVRAGASAVQEIKSLATVLSPFGQDRNPRGIYRQTEEDVPGTLFFLILRQLYNPVYWSSNLSLIARKININRSDETVYAQLVMKERDIKIDGEEADVLYVVREFIIFRSRDGFLMISTNIPTTQAAGWAGGFFADVSTWLGLFHLAQL